MDDGYGFSLPFRQCCVLTHATSFPLLRVGLLMNLLI